MAFRRPSAPRPACHPAARRARRAAAEALESRRLLTTLQGGDTFSYAEPDGDVVQITLTGNVVADVVGATATDGQTYTLTDLLAPAAGNMTLFAIYVRSSDADASISVTSSFAPFGGRIGALATNAGTVEADEGSGGVLLGARTFDPMMADDLDDPQEPISQLPVNTGDFGLPASETAGGVLNAGLRVADGNDLGRFIFDGAVFGRVDIGGSIDVFYAGWLLTGEAQGAAAANPAPGNFNVDGDLRNLIVADSIGADTTAGIQVLGYRTGFDMRVGGTVGQVQTRDGFVGRVDVLHAPGLPGLQTPQREAEQFAPGTPEEPLPAPLPAPAAANDTFLTPQYLNTTFSQRLGRGEVIDVLGTIEPGFDDDVDYYGVALLGGQRISVLMTDPDGAPQRSLNVGVFDPDQRLILTDYSNARFGAAQGRTLTFTADRPGVYRFAVAPTGDSTFTGTGGFFEPETAAYRILIDGAGDIAVGGIAAQAGVADLTLGGLIGGAASTLNGFHVANGDLGAVFAGTGLGSSSTATFDVDNGNLRSVEAAEIGAVTGTSTFSPTLDVPNGSVGLLRAFAGDLSVFNSGLEDVELGNNTSDDARVLIGDAVAVGVNYQVVHAQGTLFGSIIADQRIGIIRAGNMATFTPSLIVANADQAGEDGVIDLIDVDGDMGTLGAGGPAIVTGPGGNVRYIQVFGDIFRDPFFGGGTPSFLTFRPGEATTVIDDSGARVVLRPLGELRENEAFDPADPLSTQFLGPNLEVTLYGIRGSGGSVIVDVTSTGGVGIDGSSGRFAEVSRAEIRGVGNRVLNRSRAGTDAENPFERGARPDSPLPILNEDVGPVRTRRNRQFDEGEELVFENAANSQDLDLVITGGARVDLLNAVVVRQAPNQVPLQNNTRLGNATRIHNLTGGEIVYAVAESIGQVLSTGTIGLPRNNTGAALVRYQPLTFADELADPDDRPMIPRPVLPIQGTPIIIGNMLPFSGQTTGIMAIGGNILSVRGAQGVGNVLVHGSIGEVRANADFANTEDQFEGINAPIVAFNFNPPRDGRGGLERIIDAGRIFTINIGEGLTPSGSGDFQLSGIFSDRQLGDISNQPVNSQGFSSDIRGDIITNNRIGSITLTDGSMIDNDILLSQLPPPPMVEFAADFEDSLEFPTSFVVPTIEDTITSPLFDIGKITVKGNGGIIGAFLVGSDFDQITVSQGGFGVLNSRLIQVGDARTEGVSATGYGIRDTDFEGGADAGSFVAIGDGSSVSPLAFSRAVRHTEPGTVDPTLARFLTQAPNELNDLYQFLGVTPQAPEAAGVTDTGVIENVGARGQRNLTSVKAFTIRTRLDEDDVIDNDENGVPDFGSKNPTFFNYANSVGTVSTTGGPVDGLDITTGRFGRFAPTDNVFDFDLTVAGKIKSFTVIGSLDRDSSVRAVGPNGSIGTLKVTNNLQGEISSSNRISKIQVGGAFSGSITANAGKRAKAALSTLTIGGVGAGGLTVNGGVGKITVGRSFNGIDRTLTVNGSVGSIKVGDDLGTNITIRNDLKTFQSRGSIVSGVLLDVGGTLGSLKVGGDLEPNAVVRAKRLNKKSIAGEELGQIIITG